MGLKTNFLSKTKDYYEEQIQYKLNIFNRNQNIFYGNNKIKTSKYSILTFLPLNLFYQFTKIANIYFLVLTLMQTIKIISITNGVPTIAVSLAFVIGVSMAKDFLEDKKRWKQDNEENSTQTQYLNYDQFQKITWQQLRIGDVIKIKKNEAIPADMILIHSTNNEGKCFVETKNLDGETNLKHKQVQEQVMQQFDIDIIKKLQKINVYLKYEAPNSLIYFFKGIITIGKNHIPLNNDNILLRGSILKNTDQVIGIVCYVGHNTKVMKNSIETKEKKSLLEQQTNNYILLVFLILIICCFMISSIYIIWIEKYKNKIQYLELDLNTSLILQFFIRFGNWILIFGNFVPISLVVTIETVKFCQATLVQRNKNMISRNNNIKTIIQSSNLNEELGLIDYIFSDKTGTLTQNKMIFKKILIGSEMYPNENNYSNIININNSSISSGENNNNNENSNIDINENKYDSNKYENSKYVYDNNIQEFCNSDNINNNIKDSKDRNDNNIMSNNNNTNSYYQQEKIYNVDFVDSNFLDHIHSNSCNYLAIKLLGLCHSISIFENEYQATSPDELALVNFAKSCGFRYINTNDKEEMIIDEYGVETKYKCLHKIQFTSDRKRMSVIIEDENNKIYMLCKGADNVIIERSNNKMITGEEVESLQENIDKCAKEGLRTLVLAYKKMSKEEYNKFVKEYEEAQKDLKNRQQRTKEVYEKIEKDMIIIGATAIEDKLQEKVAECIKDFIKAGIKVWVLTGDKIETAITIGYACNLLESEQDMYILEVLDAEKLKEDIERYIIESKKSDKNYSVIITGEALISIESKEELCERLMKLVLRAKSVICSRVSPKQKANIVQMVRQTLPKIRTLAIGDGANDVNMIVTAHVGVGIKGLEGQQAARSSDYIIGEFRLLRKLLLNYGREYYRKNSFLILYNFWKNIILVLPQFFYAILFSNFSGITLYEGYMYQLVNVIYTSMPIIIYAIYDKEFEEQQLIKNPEYYKVGLKRIYFNFNVFVVWFVKGTIQAFCITYISSYIIQDAKSNGIYMGFWAYGMTIFFSTQLISITKIFIISNSFNIFIILISIISFITFLLSFFIVSQIEYNTSYSLFSQLFTSSQFYILIIILIALCSFVDSLWNLAQKILFFSNIDLKIDLKGDDKKNFIRKIKTLKLKKQELAQIGYQSNIFDMTCRTLLQEQKTEMNSLFREKSMISMLDKQQQEDEIKGKKKRDRY